MTPARAERRGCVQVYTGDGKGKTTAAAGLALRAAGTGQRVFIGQFIKGRDSAEMKILRQRCPEVTIEQFGHGRFIKGEPLPADREAAARGLRRLAAVVGGGHFDVVIADEATSAVRAGLLDAAALLHLLDRRPPHVELVFTGRDADPRLVERADLVTEMKKIKHGFDAGVPARAGIEY